MSQAGIASLKDNILPPDVPLIFEGNSGSGSAINHIFEIIGSGGVSTDVIGNTLTITVNSTGFTWNIVTSASPTNPIQIIAENGYITSGVSLVTFLLPLAPNVGDTFKVFSLTSRFELIPNANQKIVVGTVTGLLGSTGTLTSNSAGDEITITYLGSNTFQSESPQGTMTIVTS